MTSEKEKNSLIDRLFAAGSHFGFSKSRRHPTVVPYLYGSKYGTDIFDLEKTTELILKAKEILHEAGKTNKTVLFVGTKDEISHIVEEQARAAGMPYVTNRWIGGMLTNFSEIKKRLARLGELTEQVATGELERKYTKKERVMISRELEKLNNNFSGIRNLERTPQLAIVVDPRHDVIAVREAHDLNIPIIGISSSDGNLRYITYPVIANDSLQSSVSLLLEELTSSLKEGKKNAPEPKEQEKSKNSKQN